MDKYIKSDNILDIINSHYQPKNSGELSDGYNLGLKAIASCVANLPGEAVAPIVHGKWELLKNGDGICSVCRYTSRAVWDMDRWQNFCGHCGAKMDEE